MSVKPIYKSSFGRDAILDIYDGLLAQWPVPMETFTVPTAYGQTFVVASGPVNGPPLILLHGSSSNSAMWLGDVAELSQHFRCFAVDLPGEPGKSEAVRPDLDGAAHAEWMADVMDALSIESASFVGMSLGGWVALKFATTFPNRVTRLILLCPSGVAAAKVSFMLRAMIYLPCGNWGITRLNRLLYGDQPIPDEAVEYGTLIMQNFNPRLERIPLYSNDELERLTMPVLLIVGAQDPILPSDKTAERLELLLSGLRVNMLPDHGHVLIDQADEIVAFLLQDKSTVNGRELSRNMPPDTHRITA